MAQEIIDDFFGNPLDVGDIVLYCAYRNNCLYRGKITKRTRKTLVINEINKSDELYSEWYHRRVRVTKHNAYLRVYLLEKDKCKI